MMRSFVFTASLIAAIIISPTISWGQNGSFPSVVKATSGGTNLDKAQKVFELLLKRTPDDPDVYRYLGDVHAAKNERKKADDYYLKYSSMKPDDYYPRYRMGELAWAADRHRAAKKDFKQSMALIPPDGGDLQTKIANARMTALIGDRKESDELYGKLMAKNPDNQELIASRIDTLIDTKKLKTAQTVVDHYVSEHPDSYELRRTQVRVLTLRYKYDQARRLLEGMMKEYPGDRGLKEDYAYLHYNEGDWYQAVPLFEELNESYPNSAAYGEVMDELFRLHRPTLYWGFGARFVGFERRFGPYIRFVHPINTQWSYDVGYTFDQNKASIPGYNPDYTTFTHDVDMLFHYKPYRTVVLSGGIVNQIARSKYSPAAVAFFDLNDPVWGLLNVDFAYNRTFNDPTNAIYFDGKKDRVGFAYENRLFDRLIVSALYSSIWYRVNGDRIGRGQGDDFGREDVGGGGLQAIVIRKPEIRLGYGFVYSKFHVKNNYLDLIPLIQESARHNIIFGFFNEWNKWITTDLTGFLGHDSKRGASLSGLDLYGFAITNRVKINKRFEIAGTYEYSSESLLNDQGRYQFFSVDFLYRF